MQNSAANGVWASSRPADLTDWVGENVRLAWHYTGDHENYRWALDDICVAVSDNAGYPTSACASSPVFFEDFDTPTAPGLPTGWTTAVGDGNGDSTANWHTLARPDDAVSAPNRARIANDGDSSLVSRYLISPAFLLEP